jgi:predicted nucleic acid-binding protein
VADTFTAIFDACVLYPFALRDLLVQLATTELFRGRWSPHIHGEWMRSVLEKGDPSVTAQQLEQIRQLMDRAVLDCVVTGYEKLIDGLELPDPDDRHVLAAAIRCGAQVIVTRNLKDFPKSKLAPYGIEAQHPDEFVSCLMDLSPSVVCTSVRVCRERLKSPPFTVENYLQMLERQDLFVTVTELRGYAALL